MEYFQTLILKVVGVHNVEPSELSDEDLQAYCDLCENGVIDAEQELRRRGL